jgi:primosomal protein N'
LNRPAFISEESLAAAASELSAKIEEKLKAEYSDLPFIVYGPFEAQVYKLNEKYRMRTVVKCRLSSRSRRLFSELLCEFASKRGVTLSADLNPLTV